MSESKIFKAAAKMPVDQRSKYLDEACGDNVHLRKEVESLLGAADNADSFLEKPAVAVRARPQTTETVQRVIEGPGSVVGPYRLMERIGEGGFGLVFVAQQQEPVRRKVAIKVIKPGMDSKDVVARFEAERQALALMDHPNIAKVLDAGTTDTGRPYFVMELIKGVSITDYCDDHELTTQDRLELFISVCRAVQHAHAKGVIHRDLKPTNILVSPHDGIPVVKVIDFGIAKAIGQQLTDRTIYTSLTQMLGTPLYMSPEQAEINALDVDIRSDVYSLGVLLYELLTGTTPFDRERFSSAAVEEIKRIIREEEPPKPSRRLSTLGESISLVSKQRSTEPTRLTAAVKGDLDWIVMRCLEKDRSRRYQTAISLAEDVKRFLADEPVEACPPSTIYRSQKFIRRNRTALAIAATFVLLAIGAIAVTSRQAMIARTQAYQFRTLVEEYRESQMKAAFDFALDGKLERTREISQNLERTLQALEKDYRPGTITHLLDGTADFYSGETEQSKENLDAAVRLDPTSFIARAMQIRTFMLVGDWPRYVEQAQILELPPNPSYHESLFYWQSQLEINQVEAAKQLKSLVDDRTDSAFAIALLARANLSLSVQSKKFQGILPAIELAKRVVQLDTDNTLGHGIVLAGYSNAIAFSEQLKADPEVLTQEAKPYLDHLIEALKGRDGAGHLVVAQHLWLTGRRDQAANHFARCLWPDFAAAALSLDRREKELKLAESKWGSTKIADLNRTLVRLEAGPAKASLERYRQLVSDDKNPVFRLACLQIPLRLREPQIAKNAAKKLLQSQHLVDGEIPHLVLPLKLIAAQSETERRSLIEEASRSGLGSTQVVAYYWLGHVQLSDNRPEDAVESFDRCVNAENFGWTYQFWAECLKSRLDENLNWPFPESRTHEHTK